LALRNHESAYNPNGTPLYESSYSWEDGGWALNSEVTYQYDARGVMTGGTFYDSNIGKVIFPLTVSGTPENLELSVTINGIIYAKMVLHYDPRTMKLLGREYFEMDEETGVMRAGDTEEYTYDAAGRLLTELYWDDDYAGKTEYTYNAAGRKLSVAKLNAKSKAGPFTVYDKTEYEYAGDWLERIRWYLDNGDGLGFALREITVFFYAGGMGNGQVTLTDTQTTLSVSSLPSGIYFVTVRSGKGTATFKIIKK
jgi:hypothetical protein